MAMEKPSTGPGKPEQWSHALAQPQRPQAPVKAPVRAPVTAKAKPAAGQAGTAPARQGAGKTAGKYRGRRPGMSFQTQLVMAGICLGVLAFGLPTALMLSLALPPTFCAFLVVHRQGYYVALSISALNIAGTWPFLLKLWTTGHTVANAMAIIVDPVAWLIIYGAAAVGWAICLLFPILVSGCMSMFSAHRLKDLKRQQKKLLDEWGPEVANKTALGS